MGEIMRTYVRMMMGPGPHRPVRELEGAIRRGDLAMASAIARDLAHARGRPIGLDLALELLPLVAAHDLSAYDTWACRWLARWLTETSGATIDRAAELAGALAHLPAEPAPALAALRRGCRLR
jgi:hypothetical protein